jgi:hypothetical protein
MMVLVGMVGSVFVRREVVVCAPWIRAVFMLLVVVWLVWIGMMVAMVVMAMSISVAMVVTLVMTH